ncbi:hypothetical protein C8F04DRAFT_333175 [Mycena alexandri]|uniref:Uncharacterized protein n=1 Tax=Mycena alexandri TaxID=1745969 RepID=A0AAD6T746_9AGAR|nr:hypothetical protein C8F04DRAFT_333175 [Mycena alexandri]
MMTGREQGLPGDPSCREQGPNVPARTRTSSALLSRKDKSALRTFCSLTPLFVPIYLIVPIPTLSRRSSPSCTPPQPGAVCAKSLTLGVGVPAHMIPLPCAQPCASASSPRTELVPSTRASCAPRCAHGSPGRVCGTRSCGSVQSSFLRRFSAVHVAESYLAVYLYQLTLNTSTLPNYGS